MLSDWKADLPEKGSTKETCSIHSEAQRKIAQGDTGAGHPERVPQLLGHFWDRTREGLMATRAAAFCLEMLTFGHPERVPQLLQHTFGIQRTRRGPMATRAAAFCLEMLRFGHPERVPQSPRHAAGRQCGRGEGVWPLAQQLFA